MKHDSEETFQIAAALSGAGGMFLILGAMITAFLSDKIPFACFMASGLVFMMTCLCFFLASKGEDKK